MIPNIVKANVLWKSSRSEFNSLFLCTWRDLNGCEYRKTFCWIQSTKIMKTAVAQSVENVTVWDSQREIALFSFPYSARGGQSFTEWCDRSLLPHRKLRIASSIPDISPYLLPTSTLRYDCILGTKVLCCFLRCSRILKQKEKNLRVPIYLFWLWLWKGCIKFVGWFSRYRT